LDKKRGRPPKWDPQIIAGWRYAKGATVAQAAKKWMVSDETVKPVVANLKGRLLMLEACRRENEAAMARRDVPFRRSAICAPVQESEQAKTARQWRAVLEMDSDDDDDKPWELTPWQERHLFGGGS
jgi:hypothetical protein